MAKSPSAAFTDLHRFVQRSQTDLKHHLLKAAAAEALTQVQLEFRRSEDPYGRKWAPLKHRVGKPLRDSGRLANSFTSRISTRGFIIGTNVDYFPPHQHGARGRISKKSRGARRGGIPQRMMLPEPALSERWLRAIDKACQTALVRFQQQHGGPH